MGVGVDFSDIHVDPVHPLKCYYVLLVLISANWEGGGGGVR